MNNPVDRYDETFLAALPALEHLAAEPAVEQRWAEQSVLPKMSVGALACHLSQQLTHTHQLLSSPTDPTILTDPAIPTGPENPSGLPLLSSADEHYANAAWVTTTSPDDPENDRSDSDEQAARGVHPWRTSTASDIARVTTLLTGGTATDHAALPWQTWALPRDAFLLTRMLEIVVHSDDLALSIGVPTPVFPDEVFTPVINLLTRLSVRRNGQSALISTLSRRERHRPVSAF
ncbi:hypothetical protein [Kineosporia succinea]|uniref:Mycothiol maleylpyruvate isomerase-like protein n=1 Tax=Kineosporia succinea TaxID=84632 RepID=A0ABT9PCR5_9ACTN|nr:hypothetical protein [Kineosporia succinea]MDP9829965.1 hypothetical protein [Kineosporia succinea]